MNRDTGNTANLNGEMRSSVRRRWLATVLSVLVTLGLAGSALADMDRITWAALPERVADQLVPVEQLRLADWCEARGDSDPEPATVLQYIENTFYQWEEHEILSDDGEERICIRMIKPERQDLTAEEAQVLLSGSRLFLEAQPSPHGGIVLDANDPEFDAEAFDITVDVDDPIFFEPPLPFDDDPFDGPMLLDRGTRGRDDNGAAPRNPHGEDDRERVTDTTRFPWNTIAYLSIELANGQTARATGTLVGPNMVLTNGHVAYSPSNGGFAASITVSPAQWQTQQDGEILRPYGTKESVRITTNEHYKADVDFDHDYGAVFIDEPFDGINTYIPLVFNVRPGYINIAGYPSAAGSEPRTHARDPHCRRACIRWARRQRRPPVHRCEPGPHLGVDELAAERLRLDRQR